MKKYFLFFRNSVLVTTLSFPSIALSANDSLLNTALSGKFNVTNAKYSSSNDVKSHLANSSEIGFSVFLSSFGVEVFGKKLSFEKINNTAEGTKTNHFKFSDTLYGTGVNLSGRGLSLRGGLAYHDIRSQQEVVGKSSSGYPNGGETGEYYGLGLFGAVADGVDLLLDFTHFRLPESRYQINEISAGLRFIVIGDGLPQKTSKKEK